MSLFEKYDGRRKQLLKQMQTLAEFEKTDETAHLVFEIAREILSYPNRMNQPQWLLISGAKLAAYFGYLDAKSNEAWADYKTAEVALKEVRDALMLALKNEHETITAAKASAGRETAKAEVDVIVREKRSRDFATSAHMADRMLSFIQSTLGQLKSERTHYGTAERGRPAPDQPKP